MDSSPAPRRRRLSISWASKVNEAPAPLEVPKPLLPVQTQDLHRLKTFSASAPKVALASCTKGCHAERLREWLFWHLAKGVQLILFRWEGQLEPEQQAILDSPMKNGRVMLLERSLEGKASGSFQRVMTRQIRFVHKAIKVARERGFDFLLHLDDDELLYPEGRSIPEVFQSHLRSSKRCVHFENLEAVFQFQLDDARPFSRPSTKFRQDRLVLYCNGKSAANLACKEVYASGVHHFCKYNRAFVEADPKFGLHDEDAGCSHPDCCVKEVKAQILHFDSPSFLDWQAKFALRASADMTKLDEEEMDLFPFKKSSVRAMKEADVPKQKRVYRYWRCFPGRKDECFHPRLSGMEVEAEFERLLAEVRTHSER
ncbi:Hypothetical protein (Fragment) [Durusdinium trenchii]|uniref:Glycosyltransferase family 92 protein n=1 Tax=Durusdinium trenchii TaxID=1381693 RepID=A0ABP0LU51_9DINO